MTHKTRITFTLTASSAENPCIEQRHLERDLRYPACSEQSVQQIRLHTLYCLGKERQICQHLRGGDNIKLLGRVQSRVYQKRLSDDEIEERVAYEISVSKMEVVRKTTIRGKRRGLIPMIKVVCGSKGIGKTKYLVGANKMLEDCTGEIVFINHDNSLIHSLKHPIRYVNTSDFPIKGINEISAFISGIIAENYDVKAIFMDGLDRHIKDQTDISKFFEKLKLCQTSME